MADGVGRGGGGMPRSEAPTRLRGAGAHRQSEREGAHRKQTRHEATQPYPLCRSPVPSSLLDSRRERESRGRRRLTGD
eukprot:scaffold8507_cov81-Isochrysis_galbana.AAC.2